MGVLRLSDIIMKLLRSAVCSVIVADPLQDRLSRLENDLNRVEVENRQLAEENEILKAELEHVERDVNQERAEITEIEDRVEALEALRYLNPPGNCQSIYEKGGRKSGLYIIQPNGSVEPFEVFCDFETARAGDTASVNFLHGLTDDFIGDGADGCADPFCLKLPVEYTASMEQIQSIIDTSTECSQDFKYFCSNTQLSEFGRWLDRNGVYNQYWDGAHAGEKGCACDLNWNPGHCDGGGACSCDARELNKRDFGVLTDMDALPVVQLEFGDLEEPTSFASVQLGPFSCRGPAIDNGSTQVQSNAFSYSLYGKDFIGQGVVPVDTQLFDDNSGFDIESSTFIAPQDGTYYLTVQLADIQRARVQIQVNGSEVTYTDNSVTPYGDWDGSFLNMLKKLQKGDRVQVVSTSQDTNIHCCNSFVFSGFRI